VVPVKFRASCGRQRPAFLRAFAPAHDKPGIHQRFHPGMQPDISACAAGYRPGCFAEAQRLSVERLL